MYRSVAAESNRISITRSLTRRQSPAALLSMMHETTTRYSQETLREKSAAISAVKRSFFLTVKSYSWSENQTTVRVSRVSRVRVRVKAVARLGLG